MKKNLFICYYTEKNGDNSAFLFVANEECTRQEEARVNYKGMTGESLLHEDILGVYPVIEQTDGEGNVYEITCTPSCK